MPECLRLWLQSWQPSEPVPANLAARLPEALEAVEKSLQPATSQEFLVALDQLWAWVEMFGVVVIPTGAEREKWFQDRTRFYYDALQDLPTDLLVQAIAKITSEQRFRVLPMPGDIREAVAGDLSARRNLKRRLSTAAMFARLGRLEADTEPMRTQPDPVMADKLAKLRKSLPKDGPAKTVPAERTDDQEDIDRKQSLRIALGQAAQRRLIERSGQQ